MVQNSISAVQSINKVVYQLHREIRWFAVWAVGMQKPMARWGDFVRDLT